MSEICRREHGGYRARPDRPASGPTTAPRGRWPAPDGDVDRGLALVGDRVVPVIGRCVGIPAGRGIASPRCAGKGTEPSWWRSRAEIRTVTLAAPDRRGRRASPARRSPG